MEYLLCTLTLCTTLTLQLGLQRWLLVVEPRSKRETSSLWRQRSGKKFVACSRLQENAATLFFSLSLSFPHCTNSLKTNWLKWSADYAGAAHAFDKAGTTSSENLFLTTRIMTQYCYLFPSAGLCYRNAKAYDKSRQAYERAAEAHYKNAAYPQRRKKFSMFTVCPPVDMWLSVSP